MSYYVIILVIFSCYLFKPKWFHGATVSFRPSPHVPECIRCAERKPEPRHDWNCSTSSPLSMVWGVGNKTKVPSESQGLRHRPGKEKARLLAQIQEPMTDSAAYVACTLLNTGACENCLMVFTTKPEGQICLRFSPWRSQGLWVSFGSYLTKFRNHKFQFLLVVAVCLCGPRTPRTIEA